MKLLDQVNLFKINNIEKTIEVESLLGPKNEKLKLEKTLMKQLFSILN